MAKEYVGEVIQEAKDAQGGAGAKPYTGEVIPLSQGGASPAAKPAQPVPPPLSAGDDSTAGFVSGNLNKGLATVLGGPVDVISGGLNLASMGNDILKAPFRGFAPGNWQPPIQNPKFGGQWFEERLRGSGMIGDSAEPQSPGGRYAAAALQMAPGALVGRPSPRQIPRALAATTTSGIGSQAARDIGGDEWAGVGAMAPGAFQMQHKGAGVRATEGRQAEAFGKARELGIPVPPSALKPDKAQQGIQNQGNKALRQPEGTEFTPKTLQAYRDAHYADYEAVIKSPALKGGVMPTPAFQKEIQTIGNEIEAARANLPETFKGMRPVIKLLSEYGYAQMPQGVQAGGINVPPRQQPIPPEVAMRAVKKLRNDASSNFSSDKPEKVELARVQKRLANSIEDMIGENLQRTGDQGLMDKFKQARTAIGRSHDYQAAMEPGGRINAQKLAAMQNEGAPLSGGTEKIADVAGAFPGAVGRPKPDETFTRRVSPMAIEHPTAVAAHQIPRLLDRLQMNPVGQAMIDPRGKLTPEQQQMLRYFSAVNAQNRSNQIPTPP